MKFLQVVSYPMLLAVMAGCASRASTTLLLGNISEAEVARALWKTGGTGSEYRPFGPSADEERVWPDLEEPIKKKIVMKYERSGWLWTDYGKDTIRIEAREPNNVSLSLRCEGRTTFAGVFSFALFPDYNRSIRKERSILLQTVHDLQQSGNVTVEAAGEWKPPGRSVIVQRDGTVWAAYRGEKASIVRDYLATRGFWRSAEPMAVGTIYERWTAEEPTLLGPDRRSVSLERVVLKEINSDSTDQGVIVAIGIAALGIWQKDYWVFGSGCPYMNSEEIRDGLINSLCHEVSVSSNAVDFIDPSPWIEKIKLSKTAGDIRESLGQLRIRNEQKKRRLE